MYVVVFIGAEYLYHAKVDPLPMAFLAQSPDHDVDTGSFRAYKCSLLFSVSAKDYNKQIHTSIQKYYDSITFLCTIGSLETNSHFSAHRNYSIGYW